MKYLLIMIAMVVTACSSVDVEVAPPSLGNQTEAAEYLIGVGDTLNINVWRNADLTSLVIVRPDGKITMPLIGDIAAASNTPVDLSEQISEKLKNYVRSPQVSVIVENPSSSDFQRRVRITGAVKKPQSLPYRDGMTVLDIVLLAGGPNNFASENNAKLYRQINGELKVYPVNFKDILEKGLLKTNYALQPSDLITVPERTF